jgi:hypothetical protein
MASMIYPEPAKNRTFLLTWEGMSFNNKKIDLLVAGQAINTVEDVKGNENWQSVGSIASREELENGKEFNYAGSSIFVQHKKVFWFIKELALTVDGVKLRGNSWTNVGI